MKRFHSVRLSSSGPISSGSRLCLLLTLLALAHLPWLVGPASAASTYRPQLLKAGPPPTRLVVLDLTADKAGGEEIGVSPGFDRAKANNAKKQYRMYPFYSEAKEALGTHACLQGLINRRGGEKVYFTSFPIRWLWDGDAGGPGNASKDILAQNLIPVPREDRTAELSHAPYTGKQYPALLWLLDHYVANKQVPVRGKIIAPAATGFDVNMAICAAITASGFEDGLFVSEKTLPFLEANGWGDDKLPVLFDLRGKSNLEAARWVIERYGSRADLNKTLAIVQDNGGDLNVPAWFDYIAATRTLAFFLRTAETGPEKDLYQDLLVGPDPKNPRFPYGTLMIGGVENQKDGIQLLERMGYNPTYGHLPNASVTSALETDPAQFRPAAKRAPLTIDPNGAYIAYNEADGDALDFTLTMFKHLLRDPAAGQAPLGFRVNPLLIDLFPTLFEWFTKCHPHNTDLVMSMNDASSPYTPEGEAFWRARYKYYFEHCNGAMAILNHFNPWRPAVDNAFRIGKPEGIQPLMIIAGHINPAGQDSTLEVRQGVVYARPGVSDEGFIEGKPWDAPECSEKRIQHEIGNIKAHLANNAKPGEPLFIMERGWISTGARTPGDAFETMKRLRADKSITRNPHFVTPGQLATTFAAYQQSRGSAAAEPVRNLANRSYWLGNTFPGGSREDHVQMIVNDLAVQGDRLFANSTWDEGNNFMVVHSTKDGTVLGKVPMQQVADNWVEGAYGIAADDQYVYVGGYTKKWSQALNGDEHLHVIFRFNHDASNAAFPGGVLKGNAIILSTQTNFYVEPAGFDDFKKIAGAAVYQGDLFVSDPNAGKVHVIKTADMRVQPGRALDLKRPRWLAVDRDGYLWVVDGDAKRVKKFTRGKDGEKGAFTGVEIKDVELPAGICVDRDGNLLVADNGLARQQVRTYRTDGTLLRTFGRPAYGKAGGDTFFGLTAAAADAQGNLYTAAHGVPGEKYRDLRHDRVGRGAEVAKFSADGQRQWTLYGLEWVTCGDLDPGSETDYFTADNWYELDHSIPTQPGIANRSWHVKAWTMDPIRYPDDSRLHVFSMAARVERVQGRRLMLVTSDGNYQFIGIYRFDAAVAVPVALLSRDFSYWHPMTGEKWPKDAPTGAGLWVDEDGDGAFDTNEFQPLGRKLDGWGKGDMQITPDGALYFHDWNTLFRVPFEGFDSHGTPKWKLSKAVAAALPEADIGKLIRISYVPGTDVALVGCYAREDAGLMIDKLVGNDVRRYNHWSKLFDGDPATQPDRAWRITPPELPYKPSDGGHHARIDKHSPVALHAVDDDYFFVGYDMHSQPGPDGQYAKKGYPDIRVYRMKDARFVGIIEPQKELLFGTGAALDIAQGSMSVHRLKDGRYAIFTEDYCGGKNPYYLWKPEADRTGDH